MHSITDTATTAPTRPGFEEHGSIESLVDRFAAAHRSVTMLAVWAHPDDEAFLGAGLMSEVAARGGRVVTATASLGEQGLVEGEVTSGSSLADVRRAELRGSLAALGGDELIELGLADGSCDDVPVGLGSRIVGHVIDEVRPDLVVTFGPDGVTGHPDHRAVGAWVRAALRRRGDRVPMLTTAAGAVWPEHCVAGLHRIDAFWPGFPDRLVGRPRWSTQLRGEHLRRKLDALGCHASQIGPVREALGSDGLVDLAEVEAYCAGNPSAEIAFDPRAAVQAA